MCVFQNHPVEFLKCSIFSDFFSFAHFRVIDELLVVVNRIASPQFSRRQYTLWCVSPAGVRSVRSEIHPRRPSALRPRCVSVRVGWLTVVSNPRTSPRKDPVAQDRHRGIVCVFPSIEFVSTKWGKFWLARNPRSILGERLDRGEGEVGDGDGYGSRSGHAKEWEILFQKSYVHSSITKIHRSYSCCFWVMFVWNLKSSFLPLSIIEFSCRYLKRFEPLFRRGTFFCDENSFFRPHGWSSDVPKEIPVATFPRISKAKPKTTAPGLMCVFFISRSVCYFQVVNIFLTINLNCRIFFARGKEKPTSFPVCLTTLRTKAGKTDLQLILR